MTYIPRYSESGDYVEWQTVQDDRLYCIIQEGDISTIMYQTSLGEWIDSEFDIDLFLDTYNVVLL